MFAAILFLCGTINVWAQSANNIPADIDAADATIIEMGKAKGNSHMGDVNGDGTISVSDVSMLVRYILGEDEVIENFKIENAVKIENADINGDGNISVSDVMALVDMILNGENSIDNIVVNGADGITYGGGGSGPAHAGENHIWE